MKKFLFLAIAAAAMTSCSQDETLEVAQKQAIQFGEIFVGKETRAIDPSHVATNIDEFNVWGTLTGKSNNKVNLYVGAKVTRNGAQNGQAFTCDKTEYWTPEASYVFAAVANHKDVIATNGLPETITFDYTTGDVDLLYTKSLNNVTTDGSSNPTGGVNDSKIVNFTFDHLLSKLQFKFINDATSEKHIFKVKDIKIAGLPASGTYTVGSETPWVTTSTTNDAVSFGNATNATTANADAEDILKSNTAGITSNNARLVIPNNNTLTITFVKELYYDTDGNGQTAETELIYSDASKTEGDKFTSISLSSQTFAANGNYVLVVKLTSGNKIEFTVQALNDWSAEATVSLN